MGYTYNYSTIVRVDELIPFKFDKKKARRNYNKLQGGLPFEAINVKEEALNAYRVTKGHTIAAAHILCGKTKINARVTATL